MQRCMSTWTLFVILCLQLVQSITSMTVCVSPVPSERKNTSVAIDCSVSSVIYTLDVTASDDGYCGKDPLSCMGQSPDLIMHMNTCMWRSTCRLPFPEMKLITSQPVDGEHTCYYKSAESMEVTNVRCIPTTQLSEMCHVEEDVPHKSGLIRSHAQVPWFYDSSVLFEGNRACRRTFDLSKILNKSPKNILVVEVRMLSICDTEELVLTTESGKEERIDKDAGVTKVGYIILDSWLKVTFSGDNETCGCEGFLLCYKVYETDATSAEDISKLTVCDDLSSPAERLAETVTPVEEGDASDWPITEKDAEIVLGEKDTVDQGELPTPTATNKPKKNRRNRKRKGKGKKNRKEKKEKGKKGKGRRKDRKNKKNRKNKTSTAVSE